MRAAHSLPPLLGALAAVFAIALAAPTDPDETYLVCKYEKLCTAWPQNAGYRAVQHAPLTCGITKGLPKPQQYNAMQLLEKKGPEGMTKVYCDFVYDMGKPRYHARRRVARQAGIAPRGRFRGQTQSQYLAIERGGGDEGKAEAHSAADSSRASVSGNSGMGQAQSQSMYDPSCDDCYGKSGPEVGSFKKGPYVNDNNGFGPGHTNGQSLTGPGRVSSSGNNQNGGPRFGSYGSPQPGTQGYQYYGVPSSSNNFAPGGVMGIGPNKNGNYPSGQGGTSQGPGPGQDGPLGPLTSETLTPGSLVPSQGSSVTGYGPRQQGYGGYAPNQIRPGQDNNLGNRYDPSHNRGPGNNGPSLSGGSGNYAPSPSSGPGNYGPSLSGGPGNYGPSPSSGLGNYGPSLSGGTGNYGPSPSGGPGNYGPSTSGGPRNYGPSPSGGPGNYGPGLSGGQRNYGPSSSSGPGNYGPNSSSGPGNYGPGSSGGPGNYGPITSGRPGGESYAPGSLINPPSTGLHPLGTNVDSQPKQIGSPGSYNPMPFGNSYQTGGNLIPGNFKPGQNGVFSPDSSGSIPNGNQIDTISNGQGPQSGGGAYNPGQASVPGGLGGVTSPQGNINTNQATLPGRVYNPDQIGGKNILNQPQGGNWPLTSYSPGSSPYFCCTVGPDGNLIPAGGVSYPTVHNQYGQGKPGSGSRSSGPQNGPGYAAGSNNLIQGQPDGAPSMGPTHGTNTYNNNYGPRHGIPNDNNNYGPPANMALPPSNGVSYTPGSSKPVGNENYLNPNSGSGVGSGYLPGQNGGRNDLNYKPVVGVSGPGAPGTGGSFVESGNGIPGTSNYAPSQGNLGNVGRYVPGNVGPPNIGAVTGPSQGPAIQSIPSIGSYGPVTYPGKIVDGTYNPVLGTIPGSGSYIPGQSGSTGGSYNPQQGETPGSKIGYGTNTQVGLGGNGQYLPGQSSGQGEGPNYVQGTGYGPDARTPGDNNFGSGPLGKPGTEEHYGTGIHPRPGGNIFGTNSEPSNMQSYVPGTNLGPTNSVYGPGPNRNSNGSGNLGPGINGLVNVGDYNPSQGVGAGGKGIYGPGQGGTGQPGSYTPGIGGRPNIYGTEPPSGYGSGSIGNAYDQRFTGQSKEYDGVPQNFTDPNAIADGDDSEAEASVSQAANGTTASASSRGGNDKGRAQTNVHGTYTGSGSFSAQAQITGENKEAESEVSGGKKGASSSAQGSGRNNKSQANVQLGSETGSVQTQSLTNGAYHSSNSQVQGSIKGGMADAQARGPGSTSSQAQIGFTPYKEGDKAHDLQKIPFVGGGVASAQSSGRSGQSQSQLHGTFKYGITYNGAAQSGGSVDKDAVFPNRLSFDKIDVFDENNKNINVETEKPTAEDQTPSTDPAPPLESVPSEEVLPAAEDVPRLSNLFPVEASNEKEKKDEETLKNSESRYSSHTHQDHHPTSGQSPAPVGGNTRSFQSGYGSNGAEYEYTTDREDVQPDEYDTEGADVEQGEYSNYDEIPRETLTHQSLQSPRKTLEVKQTTGGNTQHIVLGSLENHDAEITQRNSERPDESKTYQPGERVPGTGGYTIPAGFTGSVKSVASKENTYVVGSKESPSQAQTVRLIPGAGRVRHTAPGRAVSAGQLRSLPPRPRDHRYVSVSKSVARDLDAEDHVRKQYSHSYYTKSSSCGFFTFTCTMVSGAEGRKKVCRPKIPTNPDGTPIRC